MMFPKITDDLAIISKLGDNPGSDDGLTADGLKAKFDEAAILIKEYLNNNVVDSLNNLAERGDLTLTTVGVGTVCASVDNWDNALVDGYYYSNVNSVDGNLWWGFVVARSGNYVEQRAFRSPSGIMREVHRSRYDGNWQPWEWVNPPLTTNVEYRTTDRIDSKPVYKKINSDGILLYRLDGETTWKKYTELIGLSNVNNTSDADKPVSTAQAAAIADAKKAGTDAQADSYEVRSLLVEHVATNINPHHVTAAQVGLGNVNNTSDANKPVSTAQATAIADAKKAGTDAQADSYEVRSLLVEHIATNTNPHHVTAVQTGAVPVSRTINGNPLTSNISLTAADVGARAKTWMPSASEVGALPAIQDSTYTQCYYRMNGGTKEWVNPPRVIGVEYLTTERFDNLQVFVKTFEVTMSNGGTVAVENAYRILRVEGFVQSRGALPIIYPDLNNAYAGWIRTETGKVTMYCGTSVAGKNAWITVYYTKG